MHWRKKIITALLSMSSVGVGAQPTEAFPAFADAAAGYAGQWSVQERVAFESSLFQDDSETPESHWMRALAFQDMHLPSQAVAELLLAANESAGGNLFLSSLQAAARLDAHSHRGDPARILQVLTSRNFDNVDTVLSGEVLITEYIAVLLAGGGSPTPCGTRGERAAEGLATTLVHLRPDSPLALVVAGAIECLTRAGSPGGPADDSSCAWAPLGRALAGADSSRQYLAVVELAAKLLSLGQWPPLAQGEEHQVLVRRASASNSYAGVPPLHGLMACAEAVALGDFEHPASREKASRQPEPTGYAPRDFFVGEALWGDVERLRRGVLDSVDAASARWPAETTLDALTFGGYALPWTGFRAMVESRAFRARQSARREFDLERAGELEEVNRIIRRFRDYRDLTPSNIDGLRDTLRRQYGHLKPIAHEAGALEVEAGAVVGYEALLAHLEQLEQGAPLFDRRTGAPRWPVTLLAPALRVECGEPMQRMLDSIMAGIAEPGIRVEGDETPLAPTQLDIEIMQTLQGAFAGGQHDAVLIVRMLFAKAEMATTAREANRMLKAVGAYLMDDEVTAQFTPETVVDIGRNVYCDLAEVLYAQVVLSCALRSARAGAEEDRSQLVGLLGQRTETFLDALLRSLEEKRVLEGPVSRANEPSVSEPVPGPLSLALLKPGVAIHTYASFLQEGDLSASQRRLVALERRLMPWLLRSDSDETALRYLAARIAVALDADAFAEARELVALMHSVASDTDGRVQSFAGRYSQAVQALEVK